MIIIIVVAMFNIDFSLGIDIESGSHRDYD